MEKIKIIIVDDHQFYRETLRTLINSNEECEVVAEAADGLEFLVAMQKHRADVVFMDIKMPNMDGIKATKKACNEYPATKIIAITMFEDKDYIIKMIEAGAKGFLFKNSDEIEIKSAIYDVMKGKYSFSDKIPNIL